jgi:hypothetical protein
MKLLQRLLPSQDIDALLGDIVEEARHRSRLWYWSQLVAVLVVASWKDVRAHKWLAVRATVTGLLVLPVFFYPASIVARFHRDHGFAMVLPYLLLVCVIPPTAILRLVVDNGAGMRLFGPSVLFVAAILAIVSLPGCVLLGAIWGTRDVS